MALLSATLLMSAHGAALAESFDEVVREAETAYGAGKFEEAATLLDKAYAIRHDPTLLFNKGRALQDVHPDRAIAAYEAYLAAEPGAADAPKVRLIVERLRARVEQEAALQRKLQEAEAARKRTTAPPPTPPPTRRSPSAVPWVVAGVGAATLGASIPLWLVGSSAHDDAVAARSVTESDSHQRTANGFATATTVTLVVGSVVTAVGLAWAVIDLVRSPGSRASGSTSPLLLGQGTF